MNTKTLPIGVIGGSGLYSLEGLSITQEHKLQTPFGDPSDSIIEGRLHNRQLFFLPRHGKEHRLLPSEVPYAANIFALKKLGVRTLISISAVGSLREEIKPGDLVVPSNYYDRTKSLRRVTFCGAGAVGHVSLAYPVSAELTELVKSLRGGKTDYSSYFDKTYVCMEGPHFSTRAESLSYRSQGFDIIGMTNFPEYALAREAGISYLPLCFVTDYDCWNPDLQHVRIEDALQVMHANTAKGRALLSELVQNVQDDKLQGCAHEGLKTGLLTDAKKLSPQLQQIFAVLQAD